MSKKISGAEYPLSKIFSSEFEYIIPAYQRPYAWTIDQTSELFDDLYDFYISESPEEGYFLGSIVLIKQENIPFSEVIDGQQRLTTLTILLACLTSKISGDEKNVLCKYLQEPGNKFEGLEPKPRLTLRERDKNFFAKYVQKLDFDNLLKLEEKTLETESQKNIKNNSEYLINKIHKNFEGELDKLTDFIKFIVQRCYLVAVSTPSQQSAFRVFSVMNSRGLDLQPTDIIKADIIGQLKTESERDQYNERWEDMEVELSRNGFNDLFSYIRMIYAKEKAKKALLEEFRLQVLSKIDTPQSLIIDVLEPLADALSIVRLVNYQATSNAEEVNSYLKWLKRIDNSDWIPAAILFLSQHKNSSGYVAWFFKRLERLAAFMHICAYNVNERIERYNKVVIALETKHSFLNPVAEIELTQSEKIKMLKALDGNIYELTARRRNYVVLKLDSFLSDGGATYDHNSLTIEHVLPQTVNPESEWAAIWPEIELRSKWIHRIANLMPLNMRRNVKAKNYDFEKKKKAYFDGDKAVSSYVLTTQVLNTPKWTPEHLEDRQNKLLAIFKDKWSLE